MTKLHWDRPRTNKRWTPIPEAPVVGSTHIISSRTGGDRRAQMRLAPIVPAPIQSISASTIVEAALESRVPIHCANCHQGGGRLTRNKLGQFVHHGGCPKK